MTIFRSSSDGPDSGDGGRHDLLQVIPLVTIVVLTAMISLLLWAINYNENERLRTTLISDALWVEQTLRFQLSVDEDAIARLALDHAHHQIGLPQFGDRARIHLQNNPEVLSIALFDADGRPVFSVPDGAASGGEKTSPLPERAAAAASVRPIYGPLTKTADGDLVTSISTALGDGGSVSAIISIRSLIARQIPWWITEKYAVQLVDIDNAVLAEKTRVEPTDTSLTHKISFDPPLAGAWLAISSYRVGGNLSNNLLVAGVLGLSLFAVFSLLVLYRNGLKRQAAEMRLRSEMAFRRSMEESLTVGLRARDHDGKILYVNNAFCQMTGFTAEELTGRKPPMPYWHEDRIAETLARHEALNKGGLKIQSFETCFRRSDGSDLEVQVFEAPLVDAHGRHRGWMGSIIDISDQKRAAEIAHVQSQNLQRTGRLVTLGEMASSLAHELNQPLAAIASYAAGSLNLLQSPDCDHRQVVGALEKLSLQTERAGQIIRRIQDFVRKRDPKFQDVELASVIVETASFLEADASNHNATIKVFAPKGLAPVRADRILMEQVMINLMRNGIEAMGGPSTRRVRLEVELRQEGDQQIIEVRDSGPGISPTVAGRLFEPFVTSKQDGMGMGLNICRTIIELHHGRLEHRPGPTGGTIFSIVLPVPQPERAAAE